MKARGKKLHADLVETYGGMIFDIDERLKRQEPVPDCLVKTLLQSRDEEELDHLDMSILCSAFMIGGVETVSFMLAVFITEFLLTDLSCHRRLQSCNGSPHSSQPIPKSRRERMRNWIGSSAEIDSQQLMMRRTCLTYTPSSRFSKISVLHLLIDVLTNLSSGS